MNRKASYVSIAAALANLTDEEMLALAENPGLAKRFFARIAKRAAKNIFVVALSDEEAVQLLVEHKKCGEAEAKSRVAKWRKIANDHGYNGPVAWAVREGYTLKGHASQDKGSYNKLGHIQSWELRNDEATKNSIVFWVPRLALDSTSKTIPQMEQLRSTLRQQYDLPAHHANSFGSIALLFALILAHFKRTGERVPLKMFWAASDTLHAGGGRLIAGRFYEDGLDCGRWVEHASDGVGFFFLGVEELGK